MANLGEYQKITRVLPGFPFGDGKDGALTISGDTSQSVANASCSGSATSTTLTLGAASTFANGDVVLIHQTRGTGVGQWEINKIGSGAGGTTLTLSTALNYTFTDSGASQAQVYTVPRYTTVTVNSGKTWSPNQAWDQNIGGILTFAAKVSATITGNISASAVGFLKGSSSAEDQTYGHQGEGTIGAGDTNSKDANGNGGGGGEKESGTSNAKNASGGGGGGYALAGTTGPTQAGSDNPQAGAKAGGTGGSAVDATDLTTMNFGGGGGAGGTGQGGGNNDAGGNGAGIIIAFVKVYTVTGDVSVNGGAAQDTYDLGGGGGGAGGSCLIQCNTATLGTAKITAAAGAGGAQNLYGGGGGAGSVGRIAIHHSGTVSGTTNPTFGDTTDATLVEVPSGFFAIL
jgi:hypothetical protein